MLIWVESKARRETMLRERRDDFWNEVCTALQDYCNSFTKYYFEDVDCLLENCCRVLVTRRTTLRSVLVVVGRQSIDVTVHDQPTETFGLDSDENGVFIRSQSGRITPHELSKLALESILFEPDDELRPVSHRATGGTNYPTAEGFLSSLRAQEFTPSLKGLLSRLMSRQR